MRPLPFFLRSIQTPLFLALLYRGMRCVSTKMSLYCHSILLKNEQKFAKIHKRPRAGKSEKGLKIKGFQGFRGNGEIITTMFPKPLRRVRLPYPAPKKGDTPCGVSPFFGTCRTLKSTGASELPLCKCFCAAKAFYSAKAPEPRRGGARLGLIQII